MLGASVIADGNITYELQRRLTTTSGDGTTQNPTGLGLSNISFVGRLTGYSHSDVHQEATGGWSWKDYSTVGRKSYRFYVNSVNLLHIGDTYKDANEGYVFTIVEINVTEGAGNIRCTYTGSGTVPSSGNLTIVSGTGDSTIAYTSCQFESGNPFWYGDEETGSLDFEQYATDYCNGSIDVLISYVGLNDFTLTSENNIKSVIIDGRVKPFLRAFHQQLPDAIVCLCTLNPCSVDGGMAESYGADSSGNYYTFMRKMWKYGEELRSLAQDNEFSSYLHIIDTQSGFDCENLYPTANRTVANRVSDTEVIQTNGVHPTTAGKLTIADGIYEALNDIIV